MPKRELSTIQIAAHLAQDYIEGNIADDREYAEEAEGAGNIFENLQQNLIDRRYEVDHADEDDPEAQEKNQELSDILFQMSDSIGRAVRSAKKLARSANTEVSKYTITDGKGNVTEVEKGYNYGAIGTAQKELHETAEELKDFRRGLNALKEKYPEELEKPYMQEFMAGYSEEKLENGSKVLKNCGETKTAYDWIEESKAKLHSNDFIDELDAGLYIARIVAARQLSGASRKNTNSLRQTSLTEGELDARAYELLENPAFSTYLHSIGVKEIPFYGEDESRREFAFESSEKEKPYLKFFGSRSHGGALEENFSKYLNKRQDASELPEEIFGKYVEKTEEPFQTYREYIESKTQEPIALDLVDEGFKKYDQPFSMHDAARMAAAYQLSIAEKEAEKGKNAGATFKEKRLENLANKLEKTPEFKLMMRNPNAVLALKSGKPEAFYGRFNQYKRKFRPISETATVTVDGFSAEDRKAEVSRKKLQHEAMKKLYRKLLGPSEDSRKQQEFVESGSLKYQAMVKAVGDMVNKAPEKVTDEDRMKVFAATVNYQEGREKKRFWESGQERFDLSLQIGKAATAGTFAADEFQKQVDHINELRGEPGFLQKDTRIRVEDIRDVVAEEKILTGKQLAKEAPEAGTEQIIAPNM